MTHDDDDDHDHGDDHGDHDGAAPDDLADIRARLLRLERENAVLKNRLAYAEGPRAQRVFMADTGFGTARAWRELTLRGAEQRIAGGTNWSIAKLEGGRGVGPGYTNNTLLDLSDGRTYTGHAVDYDPAAAPVLEVRSAKGVGYMLLREPGFWIRIMSATRDASLNRWKYAWQRSRKLRAGYWDGVSTATETWNNLSEYMSGPASYVGYAYNGCENMNVSTGGGARYGNGWTEAARLSVNAATALTWNVQPIEPGVVVWARLVYPEESGSFPEVWFSLPNAVRP